MNTQERINKSLELILQCNSIIKSNKESLAEIKEAIKHAKEHILKSNINN